jgi:hypothetical protein
MMKRLLLIWSIAIGALLLSPPPQAEASGRSHHYKTHHYKKYKKYKSYKKPAAAVPELDPNAAGSAMVLLLGGLAVVASRRRKDELV